MVSDPDKQPSLAEQIARHPNVRYAIYKLNEAVCEAAVELGVSKKIVSHAISTGNQTRDDLHDEIFSKIRDRIDEAIEREETIRIIQQANRAAKLQTENEHPANSQHRD